MLVLYTDGACTNNGKSKAKSSWGVYCQSLTPSSYMGRVPSGLQSNNRGELYAILQAIQLFRQQSKELECIIKTDSNYCQQAIHVWIHKWKQNNWKTSNQTNVKNKDLLQEIDRLMQPTIHIVHVSNYNHIVPNEQSDLDHWGNYHADQLAKKALEEE